ncbi:hypothetical_protein [Leishmania braziliensis MHOM/BR/75/M2904]|uniref:Hypothetical_protein n=1 Tax=Leishmania braziliensis MHOM/BR/75/M2904 TaxID=420245 RepID=A0A3P3ZE53_LEIBR|nr:hypothetical_protein [Leishmania braziliensis MHOM/BR/75/M2904]
MRGKCFTTPTGHPAVHQGGYTQLHALTSSTPHGQWVSARRCNTSTLQKERYRSQERSRPRPIAAHALSITALERQAQAVQGNSMRDASVHHMLNELVDLSHSIAALLDEGQISSHPDVPSAGDRQQEASLKTLEIERIVRRVEAHFIDRIQLLETVNASLTKEVQELREVLATQRTNDAAGQASVLRDVCGRLREESQTLDLLDKVSSDETGNGTAVSEAEHLRRVLVAEKRQRLRVEEQTQSLAEQHARVVGTLERRLKRQEEQLYDLIAAIERSYGGGSSVTAAPLTGSTERGSSHRFATPRRLLRQQLAQHQQTQRALQQYKESLCFELPSLVESGEAAATMKELGLDDVQHTLESIRLSKPLAAQKHNHDQEAAQETLVARPPLRAVREQQAVARSPVDGLQASAPPAVAQRAVLTSASDVDEITTFLENITKELESLDAQ